MKKLVLMVVCVAFILSVNAQIGIPATGQNIPHQLKSNEKSINEPSHVNRQKAFTGYERLGSYYYLLNLFPQGTMLESSTFPLLPDSCLMVYIDADEGFSTGFMGFGLTIDPYSKAWDENYEKGILPTPPNFTHPYRLDTISFTGTYFTPKGYNAANPDTLRIYVAYVNIYKKIGHRTDYHTIYYLTDEHRDTSYLAPMVNVKGYDKSKGGVIKPVVDNTITIDYILTANDTSRTWDSAGTSWFRYVTIDIPLTYDGVTPNGFEVPYGAVAFVMPTFVPGYDYELGDTLYYGETDPMDDTKWADGYPIRVNNYFSMRYFYEDGSENKVFADPFGYNNSIIAYRNLLYQLYRKDDGVTLTFQDSCYSPHYALLPDIDYYLSIDETQGGDDFPDAVVEANEIIASIYPNPAKEILTIQLKTDAPATIKLYNILGQEVKSFVSADIQTTINVADLHSGIYIIKVDQDGKRFTSKISIE